METLTYQDSFVPTALGDLTRLTHEYREKGYRLVQICPKMQEDGNITLYYTFNKLNDVVNLKIENVVKGVTRVPSVTSMFLSAFVFENEAHDLFGVNVIGNPLDFQGHFYTFAEGVEAPMTIISAAQLAAREKKAKLAAAKAAKEAKAAGAASPVAHGIADKIASMDPEKAAKVKAAMEAKAKREAEAALEAKLAGMDPEKAAKVRAAMEAKAKREAAAAADQKEGE